MVSLDRLSIRVAPDAPASEDHAPAEREAVRGPLTEPRSAPAVAAPKLLPGIPAPQGAGVALRIKGDNGGTRRVFLPPSAFDLTDGKPTRLAGPHVTVIADAPIHSDVAGVSVGANIAEHKRELPTLRSAATPATANPEGMFDAADIDLAQTTAFYALQRVHDWATRTSGREIAWQRGSLPVTVNAWVTPTPAQLNAVYSITGAEYGVALGAYGAVRDGRVEPYSGLGVGFLDVLRFGIPIGTDNQNVWFGEVKRRTALVDRVDYLVTTGQRDEAIEVVENELRWEPRNAPPSSTEHDETDPAIAQLAGRSAFYIALQLVHHSLLDAREVQSGFYDTASDRRIAAHEAGHAVLQAIKPAISTPAGLALHEAGGDLAAIGSSLSDTDTIEATLAETGGDLTKSSRTSRIIDDLEEVVNAGVRTRRYIKRDAAHRIPASAYQNPRLLTDTQDEPHFLSEIITSSLYELMTTQTKEELARATPEQRRDIVQHASDTVSSIFLDSMLYLPESGGTLGDIFGSLIAAARNRDAQTTEAPLADRLKTILDSRGIDTSALTVASMTRLPAVTIAQGTSSEGVLRTPEIAAMLAGWQPPPGATALPVEDVTVPRGLRLVRVRYQRNSGTKRDIAKPRIWTAAFTFDSGGRLVAASAAAP